MEACKRVGFYEESYGNIDQARQAYRKACDADEIEGCSALGNFERGQGNIDQARQIYKKFVTLQVG